MKYRIWKLRRKPTWVAAEVSPDGKKGRPIIFAANPAYVLAILRDRHERLARAFKHRTVE